MIVLGHAAVAGEGYLQGMSLGALRSGALLGLLLGATGFAKGGQINVRGFNALCLAGGMYFPERWVYFATMINWEDVNAAPTTIAFEAAIVRAFARVKDALGS